MFIVRLITTLALFAFALPLAGADEIYVTRDAEGNPVFTDRPGTTPSERLDLRTPNVYEAQSIPEPEPRPARRGRAADEGPQYTVRITQPADEEGVRAPDGQVAVSVSVEPGLQRGHRLELLLNGSRVASSGSAGSFTIETFDRGENRLNARVVDGERTLAQSDTTTFYLLRRSLLQPGPANPAPNLPRPQAP